jgi:hypothetical protein
MKKNEMNESLKTERFEMLKKSQKEKKQYILSRLEIKYH